MAFISDNWELIILVTASVLGLVVGVVLIVGTFIFVIKLIRCSSRPDDGRDEEPIVDRDSIERRLKDLNKEDQEKYHFYFQEKITTPLQSLFATESGPDDSYATGYYLPQEGKIRIHHSTYVAQTIYSYSVDEWYVSSEEEAENVFDTFVDDEEDQLRVNELESIDTSEIDYILEAKGIEINPDDPEWDWGGSYLERDWEKEWIGSDSDDKS